MDHEEIKKKIDERNKQLRERELSDIKKILQFPEGRRFLWRIMALAETFLSTPTDKRIIGTTIFNDIMEVAPEVYVQMQREYKSEEIGFRKTIPPDPDDLEL